VNDNGRAKNPRGPAAERARSHSQPAIEACGPVKTFGRTRAVDGVDLVVPAGIVFGLLGRNGAPMRDTRACSDTTSSVTPTRSAAGSA
jgi:hypothetical protein